MVEERTERTWNGRCWAPEMISARSKQPSAFKRPDKGKPGAWETTGDCETVSFFDALWRRGRVIDTRERSGVYLGFFGTGLIRQGTGRDEGR